MSDHSGQQIVILTTIWWWRELGRLAMSKQTMHSVHIERFNIKKLSEIEGKEQYHIEISNRFTASDKIDTEVDVNKVWETIKTEYQHFCKRESRL
jgi:hypothetical protein